MEKGLVMARPTQDEALMATALTWAKRGTCSRAQVGAVFSLSGRVVITGYNGSPPRMAHCDHLDCLCDAQRFKLGADPRCPKHGPCRTAIHAEANAIAYAARCGVSLEGSELHVTRSPCTNCAGLIIQAGVTKVTWYQPHRDLSGLALLALGGLEVVQWGV
ncbi:deoxycytidylate deaminase [Streptomyces sp. NPDC002248]